MLLHLTLVAVLSVYAFAAPSSSEHYVVHEKREMSLKRWMKREALQPRGLLPMRIGLTQSNLDKGHAMLMEVSDTSSPKYGQHYSPEEVIELFKPSDTAVRAVRNWLTASGIAAERVSLSTNKQWIQFDAIVEEAEVLLKTKYYSYEHVGTGNWNIGCDEYHVPAEVQAHIDYITPGLKMMAGKVSKRKQAINMKKRGFRTKGSQGFSPPLFLKNITLPPVVSTATQLSMCDTMITPACIAQMYNITEATKAAKGNELGIFEEGDFYSAQDLVEFFATFTSIPVTTTPKLEGIDGGFAPSVYAGGESDLDFQISYPIVYPQQEILFQTDDIYYALGLEGGGGFLNTFFDAIDGSYCNYSAFGETGNSPIDPVYPDPIPGGYEGQLQCGKYKPTHVISISYGEQEDDLPTIYQQRQCSEMMKLGMQGTTIVLASGDSGVAARSTDDGNADGCLGNGEVFNPDFPASCPYVTALGATFLPAGASAKQDAEVAVTRFPSGGGFSNIYPQPSYQSSAVNTYLTNYVPKQYKSYSLTAPTNDPTEAQTAGGIYNRAGRGYPDAAAVGDNIVIFNNGVPTLIGGTSASAPVFAAIINRINEERIFVGKSPVGFINPTLYKNPGAFHDITVGNNSGCGTMGFVASKGWDPVTGLGTPNYPALLTVFKAAP